MGDVIKKHRTICTIIAGVACIVMVVLTIFMIISVRELFVRQSRLETHIATVEQGLPTQQYEELILESGQSMLDDTMQQTSLILDIVAVGIGLFALFGGGLSIFNIWQSKELSIAIEAAGQAFENQAEIEAQRLVLLGKNYQYRYRPKYAIDCYMKAIDLSPSLLTVLHAKYDIAALKSDISTLTNEELSSLNTEFEGIISDCENGKINRDERRILIGDIRSMQGCIFGQYAITCTKESGFSKNKQFIEGVNQTIHYFKEAIKCDAGNVDYYRNLAISYAIMGKKKKLRKTLNMAKASAKQERLYSSLITSERLTKLFLPSRNLYGRQTLKVLKKFGVHFS